MKRLKRSAARALVLAAALGLVGSALAGPVNAAASGGTETITAIPKLTGVGTSLTLDAATAKTLKSLGVAGAPTASAKFDAATSTVSFPITSGYAEIHRDHNFKPLLAAPVPRTAPPSALQLASRRPR
jgi:hypothetical protein